MRTITLAFPSDLKPAPYNPRLADNERLALVRLSLSKLGFLLPLVVARDGEILSGHQRYRAAMEMGANLIPVIKIEVPDKKRRGLNILCNRATNDIPITALEKDLTAALRRAQTDRLAAALPDLKVDSNEFLPCCYSTEMDVRQLALKNTRHFNRHAGSVAAMLRNFGVDLPIVVAPGGRVVNGIGRLEAAARKGAATIPAVTIPGERAALAGKLLNLLSMDFNFEGENADSLRYGAFRRGRNLRKCLGSAFVLPVSKRANREFDIARPDHRQAWIKACGREVLDFGSGHGVEAEMLRAQGVRVTTFEPYLEVGGQPSLEAGRKSARNFLEAISLGFEFSSVFISSVLNSVPFLEDRRHIVRLCAALCSAKTTLYATARGVQSADWSCFERGDALNDKRGTSRVFPLSYEPGISIGDLAVAPKIQKYHSAEEFAALFGEFFHEVEAKNRGNGVTAVCRRPRPASPADLAESIRFEFDLPYPDGRLNMAPEALAAFAKRLGRPLGAA